MQAHILNEGLITNLVKLQILFSISVPPVIRADVVTNH